MIESLESRTLFASGTLVIDSLPPFVTSKGTLVVQGGFRRGIEPSDDVIAVSVNPKNGVISVRVNDNVFGFAGRTVKRLLVEAGSGDDRVSIAEALRRPCTVAGGSGDDILDGNRGSTLIGGAGDDKLSVPLLRTWLDGPDDIGVPISQNATPSLLSGGDGNDVLVGSNVDSVIGGRGNDLAIERAAVIDPPASGVNPQEDFGPRAQGIETFDDSLIDLNRLALSIDQT